MAKEMGITIEQLYKECAKQMKAGNGKRHIMISGDDEGNSYHELFYGFSPDMDFSSPYMDGLLPYGVTAEQVKKEYIGKSVILNRLNTDETNCTITTQEQAELKCEDGEWYLQNLSELQTTYLVLNRKIQLEEGDIIVMGNRKFKFEKKK